MNFTVPDVNLYSLLPELILLGTAAVILFLNAEKRKGMIAFLAALSVLAGLLVTFSLWKEDASGFGGLIVRDQRALMFNALLCVATLVAIALSHDYLRNGKNAGEYYSLMLFSLFGMGIMAAARDLLVIFLGIEITSLSLYILVGFFKQVRDGMEAAVKYFLLGSFSSALFLLGMAFFYGATGSTTLRAVSGLWADSPLLIAGLILVVAALGFKIAAVPFHMWAPDVYEGAPVSVASFISVVPKIASFAVLLRIGTITIGSSQNLIIPSIIFIAVASMILGNLAALRQMAVVRMLAYSGIGHIGYMLIGLLAIPSGGDSAIIFYLLIYLFMNMGAFGAVVYLEKTQNKRILIDDLAGLSTKHPVLAFSTAIFMISLAGIPPTGGFFAKFYIFKVGIEAGYLWVVLLAVLTTVVSLFYYMRVVMAMYMREDETGTLKVRTGLTLIGTVILTLAIVILVSGIMPGLFFGMIF